MWPCAWVWTSGSFDERLVPQTQMLWNRQTSSVAEELLVSSCEPVEGSPWLSFPKGSSQGRGTSCPLLLEIERLQLEGTSRGNHVPTQVCSHRQGCPRPCLVGFEGLQVQSPQALWGQPVARFSHPPSKRVSPCAEKKPVMFQLLPVVFTLSLGTTYQVLHLSSLHPPFRHPGTLTNFPLFQTQQPQLSLKFLLHLLLFPLHHLSSCLGALQVYSHVSCTGDYRSGHSTPVVASPMLRSSDGSHTPTCRWHLSLRSPAYCWPSLPQENSIGSSSLSSDLRCRFQGISAHVSEDQFVEIILSSCTFSCV